MKIKGIRKAQAEGMVRSFFTAPHLTYVEEVDVTDLIALRKKLKPHAEAQDTKLTFLPFIIKARGQGDFHAGVCRYLELGT